MKVEMLQPGRRVVALVLLGLMGVLGATAGFRPGVSGAHARGAGAAAVAGKVGVASAKYLMSDPSRLKALGATWAYNWSPHVPFQGTAGLEWVPMVWGTQYVRSDIIANLRQAKRDGRARYLLGFNEPDSKTQSNMSPQKAAAMWPQLESTGLTLGSPATAVATDGWLAQFMRLAQKRHLRVNFIALHYYQDFTDPAAVGQLRAQLIAIHNRYHRPIWITEIGALNTASWGHRTMYQPTGARAAVYMKKLFSMLNALSFVKRYAWYTDDCWSDTACHSSSLFNPSGQLTAAGHAFAQASR